MRYIIVLGLLFISSILLAQQSELASNNIVWHSQSKNSGESMPCGGGDVGLNVWVENGDLLFYIARSGAYDENNALLKAGRVRVRLSPNPFNDSLFKQTLDLQKGGITIESGGVKLNIWVDVFSPKVHVEINSRTPVKAQVGYESWRYRDTIVTGLENNENGYKYGALKPVKSYRDSIAFVNNAILFFHRNSHLNMFDVTVKQQGLDSVKSNLNDPLSNLTFGGMLAGDYLHPDGIYFGSYINTDYKGWMLNSKAGHKYYHIKLSLLSGQRSNIETWKTGLDSLNNTPSDLKAARGRTEDWWGRLWNRSFIHIDPYHKDTSSSEWQSGRNYQLFRYMLACNASGKYPTKFNGGLFTYDPGLVNTGYRFTPDFRNWGGSIFTAQNQRLVYFPMLKAGDFEVIKPAFDFYLRILNNAKVATRAYWHHGGARFPEQIENFGLSDYAEYGISHPKTLDPGVDDNPWLEYHWDTVLEFCYMILEYRDYSGKNIKPYLPLIENCVDFFDLHYQYLARLRGSKALDGNGRLILFPGSAGETFKMAYNSTSTIAGLSSVLIKLLALPNGEISEDQQKKFTDQLKRIPPISHQFIDGHETIAPARSWERLNNEESPQLYPVFPYGISGIGKPGKQFAINTWRYDTTVVKFRNYIGWRQDNIFAARLGLTDDAVHLTFAKLKNSGRRFPAFWGPGYDWTPDHNWGGSGMIGLQEMLLQTVGKKIYLFAAWPKNIDVHFKLCAPYQTSVECCLKQGKIQYLKVIPYSRSKDVISLLPDK